MDIKNFLKKVLNKMIKKVDSSNIYMLHHVTSDGIICSNCILENDNFCKFIEANKERFISIEKMLTGKVKDIRGKACLTFDDGLRDLYEIVYPYLIKKNIPFTAFIIPGFLDKEGYITTNQLIEMSKNNLVTIGAHTFNHVRLPKCSYKIIYNEILTSKKKLEQLTGNNVKIFAYPYGMKNLNSIIALKLIGFKYALTTMDFPYGYCFKPFKYILPRNSVTNDRVTNDIMEEKNDQK